MADPQTTIRPGDRVRLRPRHDWLSAYAPLAEHGRVGTVLDLDERGYPLIQFDTVRPGTKPKRGTFNPRDVIVVAVPAPAEQLEAML